MQSGDVIWLLAGIGIGLVIAMLILAGMLVIDGRRLQRRASATGDLTRSTPAEPKAEPAPARKVAIAAETPRRTSVPRPAPPAPVSTPREPVVADAKASEPAAVIVDEMMSSLAAEIARVQTAEPVAVSIEPPPAVTVAPEPAPVPLAAEPALAEVVAPEPAVMEVPEPEPVVAAPLEVPVEAPADPMPIVVAEPAEAQVEAPIVVAAPPAPKVPPLPKVTPARKFAPALPPRSPQEGGKA